MKKINLLIILMILLSLNAFAQLKVDTTKLRATLKASPVITPQQLCANKWKTKSFFAQWFEHYEKGVFYEEGEEMGYVYKFSLDGTYTLDAIIDSDGKWTINSSTKIVAIRSNLTKLIDQDAYMILEGDTITWYEWRTDGLFAIVLEKTEENYDSEE